jgi:hypothetical protein
LVAVFIERVAPRREASPLSLSPIAGSTPQLHAARLAQRKWIPFSFLERQALQPLFSTRGDRLCSQYKQPIIDFLHAVSLGGADAINQTCRERETCHLAQISLGYRI